LLNYRRDELWDAATWADIDQAVLDEVQRVRLARKLFPTEDLGAATGGVPSWVSTAAVVTAPPPLSIPAGNAEPFVEISMPFDLTTAQAEAENTLHTARALARLAAKWVAMAEDLVVFRARTLGAPGLTAITVVPGSGIWQRGNRRVLPRGGARAQRLLGAIDGGLAQLGASGWPAPYALVLGANLYRAYFSQLNPPTPETPERQLGDRLSNVAVTGAVRRGQGVLVSLAGDPITIYAAHEASASFIGETSSARGPVYNFKVSERFQFVIRDASAIVSLR
jgi:Encapsulating protein for peroxidase